MTRSATPRAKPDTGVARKAEEGQKLRNDLRLRIAELTQAITDEKAAIVAAAEARSKAEREATRWRTACAEARDALAAATKTLKRRDKALGERADKIAAAEARRGGGHLGARDGARHRRVA